jgi:hypothetical protein
MEGQLEQMLEVFGGTGVLDRLNVRREEGCEEGAGSSSTVFSPSSSRQLTNTLRHNGYKHIHSFIAIPSRSMPRWLVPAGDRHQAEAGIRIYEPHRRGPQIIKKALIGMIRTGWDGWPHLKITFASKVRLPLEDLVYATTEESHPLFALSFGRQAAVRKLAVQVMRPNGDLLGYIKLPLTDAAIERVRNEAFALERLSSFAAIKQHIPRLLYAGYWNGTYLLFQSAVEGNRGPLTFGQLHESFLRKLWDVHPVAFPVPALVDRLAKRWDRVVGRLGEDWRQLAKEVFRRASQHAQGTLLPCGVMHGDFTPWNTRSRGNQLLVFDWESASWEVPNTWDIFHFRMQANYFLEKRKEFAFPRREPAEERSFALYLLNSVSQFLEEENTEAIHHCNKLLVQALHDW